MNERNPLFISAKESERKSFANNQRGRPTIEKVIDFSPLPKSMLISGLRNNLTNVNISNESLNSKTQIEELNLSEQKVYIHNNKASTCNPQYSCNYPECTYRCKLACNLIKHKRIHTSEKPYLCDQCTFRTNFVNSLKVHKRIHTAERPYSCIHCTYKCNSSSNLKKHCLHKHCDVPKTS